MEQELKFALVYNKETGKPVYSTIYALEAPIGLLPEEDFIQTSYHVNDPEEAVTVLAEALKG